MVDAGYTSVVNLDISSVVIDKMKQKHPEMICTCDARHTFIA